MSASGAARRRSRPAATPSPTAAAIGLTNAPGPGTPSPVVAGLVLAAYDVALLAAASRTTMRRDVT